MSGDAPDLLVTDDGGVRTLTINRPERANAIDDALWPVLHKALSAAVDERGVRALVVTGTGGRFCSGQDLGGRKAGAHPLERMRVVNEFAAALYECPLPTIAKVDGPAVGAGWNLALACDFVVATPRATFAQIFAKRGLSVDFGGSWVLPRLVGLQQAKRLVLLADTIDAAEAHDLGLVTWVVEAGAIDAFVADLAARLAAGPPIATAQSKALLNAGAHRALSEALAEESRAQVVNTATDAPAAYRAFRDRTEPEFTGEWQL